MNIKSIKSLFQFPKSPFQSKTFKIALWCIGALVVLLLAFKAGEFIGSRKAAFSYRLGENYYRNLVGPRGGFQKEFEGREFLTSHGVFGSIVSVSTSTLVIHGPEGIEMVVLLTPQTVVKRFRDTVPAGDLRVNEQVTVIGSPNGVGEIEAKLIRVLPNNMPQPPMQMPPRP